MQRGVEVFPKDKAGKSWLATRCQCTCSSVYESLNFCEGEESNFWYCISHYGEKKEEEKKKKHCKFYPAGTIYCTKWKLILFLSVKHNPLLGNVFCTTFIWKIKASLGLANSKSKE